MNKLAIAISAGLTVFVLVLLGGLVFTVQAAQGLLGDRQAADSSTIQAPTPTASPVVSPAAPQQMTSDREAAYRKLIDQANARLAQDQKDKQALQAQIDVLQAQLQQANQADQQQVAISPREAALIAARALRQREIFSVETTPFNGVTAYKVTFSTGDVAYISLDGQLLATQPAAKPGGSSNSVPFAQPQQQGDDHE